MRCRFWRPCPSSPLPTPTHLKREVADHYSLNVLHWDESRVGVEGCELVDHHVCLLARGVEAERPNERGYLLQVDLSASLLVLEEDYCLPDTLLQSIHLLRGLSIDHFLYDVDNVDNT